MADETDVLDSWEELDDNEVICRSIVVFSECFKTSLISVSHCLLKAKTMTLRVTRKRLCCQFIFEFERESQCEEQ